MLKKIVESGQGGAAEDDDDSSDSDWDVDNDYGNERRGSRNRRGGRGSANPPPIPTASECRTILDEITGGQIPASDEVKCCLLLENAISADSFEPSNRLLNALLGVTEGKLAIAGCKARALFKCTWRVFWGLRDFVASE